MREIRTMEARLTRIRLHLAIYFLPLRGRNGQKAAPRELCPIIQYLGSGIGTDGSRHEAARTLGSLSPYLDSLRTQMRSASFPMSLFLFRLRSSINVLIDATEHLLNFRVSTAAGPYL